MKPMTRKHTTGAKALVCILAVALTLALCASVALAVQAPITVQGSSGGPGDTVTATVSIGASDGFGAADLTLTYDATQLDYVSSTAGSLLAGGTVILNDQTAGQIGLGFISTTDVTAAGTLLTAEFTVKSTATAGTSPLAVSVNELKNQAGDTIDATASAGSITILSSSGATTSATAGAINGPTLASMTTTAGTFSPSFSSTVTEYTLTVPTGTSAVGIDVTATDSTNTITATLDGESIDIYNEGIPVGSLLVVSVSDGTNTTNYNVMVVEGSATTAPTASSTTTSGSSGSSTSAPTATSSNPQTGDDAFPIWILLLGMGVAIAAVAVVLILRRSKTQK